MYLSTIFYIYDFLFKISIYEICGNLGPKKKFLIILYYMDFYIAGFFVEYIGGVYGHYLFLGLNFPKFWTKIL